MSAYRIQKLIFLAEAAIHRLRKWEMKKPSDGLFVHPLFSEAIQQTLSEFFTPILFCAD
jgi:hypothetical protein